MILRVLFVTAAFLISSITTAETCDGVISTLRISGYVEGDLRLVSGKRRSHIRNGTVTMA